jgi:hypothetical protein
MANQAGRKDPTRGVAIFFLVVVLLVLTAILYKGIIGRNEYVAEQRAAHAVAAMQASGGAVAASASGASQAR